MAERVCFEDTVKLSGGKRSGKVAFIGPTKFSPGVWFGVSLKKGGKNDGSVQGVRYFKCKPNKGVFIPREKIQGVTTKAKGNRCTVGDEVEIAGRGRGEIKFVGPTQFAAGIWVGIELQKKVGKNNGRVKGVRYFDCKPRFGVFVKREKLGKVLTEEKTAADVEVQPEPAPVVETVVPEPVAEPEPEPEPAPAAPEAEPEPEVQPEAEAPPEPEPEAAPVEAEPVAVEPAMPEEPAEAEASVEPAEPIQEENQGAVPEAEVEAEPEVEAVPEPEPEPEAELEQEPAPAEEEAPPQAPEEQVESQPSEAAPAEAEDAAEAVEEANQSPVAVPESEADMATDVEPAAVQPSAEPEPSREDADADTGDAEVEAEVDEENKTEYIASVADAQHEPGQWRPRGWLDDPPAAAEPESEAVQSSEADNADGDSKVEDNAASAATEEPSVEVEESALIDNATEDAAGQDVEAETEAEAVQQEDCESGAAGDEPMQKPMQAVSPRFDQAAFAMDLTATVGSPAASG